jgi:outer membrane protein OmpA-like peptidoglycan-associated protein/tetratricopeptide (TPR) repeat protein
MKNKLILLLVTIITSLNVGAQSFKSLYFKSLHYLEVYDYSAALDILLEMKELDPENCNTHFFIGNCLMNIPNREKEAIPYYEKALESLTIAYKIANPREKNAPIDAIELLGNAYHMNYEFEKAIEKYEFYGNFLSEYNEDAVRSNARKIRRSKNALKLVQNPVDVKIYPLETINSEFSEYKPLLNAQENTMFFTAKKPDGLTDNKDDQGDFYEHIYFSEKIGNNWTQAKLMPSPINTKKSTSALYLSADGQYLLSSMVNNDNNIGPLGRGIFESYKNGNVWTDPQIFQNKVNTSYLETSANMDLNKNMVFFVSDRDGGLGGKDLWVIKKLDNGSWSSPQNLGEPINTEYDEESPYFHSDGKTLYFSSKGHSSIGGLDIFKSELDKELNWSSPKNMGYPINTVNDDLSFVPTVTGNKAYFSSVRNGGKGKSDIYEMILPNQEESSLAVYKGKVTNQNGKPIKNIEVSVQNDKYYPVYKEFQINKSSGKFVFVFESGNFYNIKFDIDTLTIYDSINVSENQKGIFSYSKSIEIAEDEVVVSNAVIEIEEKITIEKQPMVINNVLKVSPVVSSNLSNDANSKSLESSEKASKKTELVKDTLSTSNQPIIADNSNSVTQEDIGAKESDSKDEKVEEHILFYDNINFKSESSDLSNSEKSKLDKLIEDLKSNPTWRVNSIGHTDNTGSMKYNQILSVLRSESVKTYMINRGISFKRIETIGMGEVHPLAENLAADGSDNPTGRAANRRVEIQIIK